MIDSVHRDYSVIVVLLMKTQVKFKKHEQHTNES